MLRSQILWSTGIALIAFGAGIGNDLHATSASELAFAVSAPSNPEKHDAFAAPGQNASGPDPAFETGPSGDGLFYVTAKVNGKPVRFIVDTGANVVVLTSADARNIGVTAADGTAINVETAGGSSAMRSVNLSHIDIAGQRIENVEGAVVDSGLNVSLLGQSLLSRMQSVHISGNRLRLN